MPSEHKSGIFRKGQEYNARDLFICSTLISGQNIEKINQVSDMLKNAGVPVKSKSQVIRILIEHSEINDGIIQTAKLITQTDKLRKKMYHDPKRKKSRKDAKRPNQRTD